MAVAAWLQWRQQHRVRNPYRTLSFLLTSLFSTSPVTNIEHRKLRSKLMRTSRTSYLDGTTAAIDSRKAPLFIDADSDVFEHVLQFMRRPSKFPLFWTKETSFEYALYDKLEVEADYFLLHDLRDWIWKKRYLSAVKTVIEVKVLSEYKMSDGWNQRRCDADIEVQSFYGSYSGEKRFRNSCAIHKEGVNIRGCHFFRGTHADIWTIL